MWQKTRRRRIRDGVRFCDGCAEVTSAEQRANRRYERVRWQVQTFGLPR